MRGLEQPGLHDVVEEGAEAPLHGHELAQPGPWTGPAHLAPLHDAHVGPAAHHVERVREGRCVHRLVRVEHQHQVGGHRRPRLHQVLGLRPAAAAQQHDPARVAVGRGVHRGMRGVPRRARDDHHARMDLRQRKRGLDRPADGGLLIHGGHDDRDAGVARHRVGAGRLRHGGDRHAGGPATPKLAASDSHREVLAAHSQGNPQGGGHEDRCRKRRPPQKGQHERRVEQQPQHGGLRDELGEAAGAGLPRRRPRGAGQQGEGGQGAALQPQQRHEEVGHRPDGGAHGQRDGAEDQEREVGHLPRPQPGGGVGLHVPPVRVQREEDEADGVRGPRRGA